MVGLVSVGEVDMLGGRTASHEALGAGVTLPPVGRYGLGVVATDERVEPPYPRMGRMTQCVQNRTGLQRSAMAGERVGRFVVTDFLGRGATSIVWRAFDTDAPNDRARDVAVKRLSVPESTADRERLAREAEALAKLDHPNVIRVREVVPDGPGIALILDLADGGTLADRLRESGPLTPEKLRELLAPVADALDAAHRVGLVHRDVKPGNVFLAADGRALLGDFGIAHDAGRTQMTRTDMAIGTAAYLDPEVLNGAEPGPASDQYALGVTMYEALTGRTPFGGAVPMAVLRAAELGAFEPLDRQQIGPHLALIVERSFARHPDDRFATVGEVAAALRDPERFAHEDGADRSSTIAFRRATFASTLADAPSVRSPKRRIIAGIAAATALVASAIGGALLRDRGTRQLSDPVAMALPACSAETQPQCVRSFLRTSTGIEVTFADDHVATYQVGERDDALRVSNWLCGERATLALYRPRTGTIYYFSAWPDSRSDEPTKVAADRTGIVRATALLPSDRDGNGCSDLALQTASARTWFLPSVQSNRLVALPEIEAPAFRSARR